MRPFPGGHLVAPPPPGLWLGQAIERDPAPSAVCNTPSDGIRFDPKGLQSRRATSVRRLRHDRMEQSPTEPHAGRGTFRLSSGGAGGGYY